MRQHSPEAGPLWGSIGAWREANETVSYLIRRHSQELKNAELHAAGIRCDLMSLFPYLDNLCRNSCLFCPEPCCLGAKIWIDFKDLLFLHLIAGPVPPAPMLADLTDVCRYLGPRGCLLDRISRPWICTWYLCPTQMAIVRRQGRAEDTAIHRAFAAIKAGRQKMEREFIRVIS